MWGLIAVIVAGLLAFGCALCRPAYARDHGQYAGTDPEIRAWVKGLTDKDGNGCCDQADGYPAEAVWDTDTGRYRVRIDGTWHDVPDQAVIEKPNRLGYAVVWYYRDGEAPHIRCFLPGGGA